MKINSTRRILMLAAALFVAVSVSAQPDPPNDPGCQDPNNPFSPPCPIPIDGGLVFLIAAGAAYGGKKAYDLNRKQ